MTPREESRLQVLNSLLAEHMTLDQAAALMRLSTRHTRRILSDYREKGSATIAHGLRGRKPPMPPSGTCPSRVAVTVVVPPLSLTVAASRARVTAVGSPARRGCSPADRSIGRRPPPSP